MVYPSGGRKQKIHPCYFRKLSNLTVSLVISVFHSVINKKNLQKYVSIIKVGIKVMVNYASKMKR
jgi:hypothetical protein